MSRGRPSGCSTISSPMRPMSRCCRTRRSARLSSIAGGATYGELEGRRLAEEAADSLRQHVAGCADAFLADTAPALGVRETRRAVGRHLLTGAEVAGLARFDDAIACGAWPQEYHVVG